MKAVFLCEAPLQVLNAVEAKRHYAIADEDAHIVLLKGVSAKNLKQQIKTLNTFGWSNFHVFDGEFAGLSMFNVWRLNSLLKQWQGADYIFLGDYRNEIMRHAANFLEAKNIVLLDDGNATIHIAQNRKAYDDKSMSHNRGLKGFVKEKLIGLQLSYAEQLSYFSIYNIEEKQPDQIVLNNYIYLQEMLKAKPQDDKVIFLGCPFSETESVADNFPEKLYLSYLADIAADLQKRSGGVDILYVAHRRECAEKLERINKIKGFNVIDFGEPIEVALSKLDYRPTIFATFFSGAIDTLFSIYDDSVGFLSYRLPESSMDADKVDTINGYYDYYTDAYKGDRFTSIKLK